MTRFLSLICTALIFVAAPALAQNSFDPTLVNNAAFASDGEVASPSQRQYAPTAPQSMQPYSPVASYYTGASPMASGGEAIDSAAMSNVAMSNTGYADYNSCDGDGCACGNCGGCNSCNTCWPRWYVEAEAIFLWRNTDVVVQSVVESDLTSTTVFDTRSADFDTGVGPRTLIGLRTSQCSAWECQYFSALGMAGSASITSPGQLSAAGQFVQLPGWNFADTMNINYSSELHNVEVNYLHTWNSLSLLGGFRFVRLSENYDLNSLDGSSEDNYNVDSENNLFGAQLGGRWRECCGRFYWELTGKAGVFGNDSNQSQFLTDLDGSQSLRNFTSYESCVAFVGDINLSVGFRLNRVWAARCGYNVLWIDQVALAADQLDFNLGPTAGRNIATDGSVFLHGINVGLEGRW